MGVPQFYAWLINRYPLVKSPYNPSTLPFIDWLFIDLNGIVSKCALDESSAVKNVLTGKRLEDIFMQVFNYVNEITQLIQPQKMLFLALDGVTPRAKMNQQRLRRFKSARKYQEVDNVLRKCGIVEKEEPFKNNSISPGTEFMYELNTQIRFFIQRKMKEDERWRKISVIFSGSDVPGESEYKALQYIRRKSQEPTFNPNTTICLYGPDTDPITLALTTHLCYICVLQEQNQLQPRRCAATKRQQYQTSYDFFWINILREYFEAEFASLRDTMGERYSVDRVIDDFVFLCLFISNDFLPRIFCMDLKTGNFEKVLEAFKEALVVMNDYIVDKGVVSWANAVVLLQKIAQFELEFIENKLEEQQTQRKFAYKYKRVIEEVDLLTTESNKEVLKEVKELKEEYEELERLERENDDDCAMSSDSEESLPLSRTQRKGGLSTPGRPFSRKSIARSLADRKSEVYKEDLESNGLNDSNSYDSTSKSDNENLEFLLEGRDFFDKEEDKEANDKEEYEIITGDKEQFPDECIQGHVETYGDSQDSELVKLEEAESYLMGYSDEETISRLLSAPVLENDIRFIKGLVNIYKQDRNEARELYYKDKFGLVANGISLELPSILTAYLQGLQFVVSYYYTSCPSWIWFYPYHYSPLVSDLSKLSEHLDLNLISQNGINFKPGKPSEPFKQLLLILPMMSLHLLPESLRHIVSNREGPLNKYYPEEFQIDPFGAVSEGEYIARIPFVDEEVLDAEYQKAIKSEKLKQKEINRNTAGTSLVYDWNTKGQEYEVESSLLLYFEKFRVRTKISKFSIENLPFDPQRILDKPPSGTYRYHKSFPSLHFIQEKKFELKAHTKNVTFFKCCVRIGQRLNVTEYKQYRKLLDQPFYCMYPFLVPCFVMGVVTPDQLITNISFQDLPFAYKKAQHRDYYTKLSVNTHDFYLMQMGILFKESMLNFALIYLESEPRRDSLGNTYSPKPRVEAIPLNFLIDTNIMPNYRGKIDYSGKDLSKEFPLHSPVVINIGPPTGSLARVVGYTSDAYDFDNIEVKIIRSVPKLNTITTAIASRYDNHRNYRSVYHVAKRLGVDVQVVLTILDCIVVKTEASGTEKSIYPERFDIGLNLIQRRNHTIVPELIICNELEKHKKSRHRTFPHFQLAPEAINLVQSYYTHHKQVFTAIAQKIRLRDPSPITAKFIFPNSEDPDLEVFKIYIWVLRQENSNLGLTNKASKVIPREGIKELEKVLGNSKNYLGEQAKHILNKVFPYNPNFLITRYFDNWVPPFYSRQPPWHKLGDRVVSLKVNGYNFAPFSAIGTVVGILGSRPENGVLKVKIEVIFDYPFIGGTNLAGRCSWGRGAIVNFDDIFNLNRWEKCIKERDPRKASYNQDWDGVFPNSYVPSFQTASEVSGTDDEVVKRPSQTNISASHMLTEDLVKVLSSKKKHSQTQSKPVKKTRNKNYNQNQYQNKTQSQPQSQPQSQSQTQLQPQPQIKSQRKPSIVPKSLGLTKSVDNADLKMQATDKSTSVLIDEPAEPNKPLVPLDPSRRLDLTAIITNNIPPVLYVDTINTSYSFSNRYSRNTTGTMEDISEPSSVVHSSKLEAANAVKETVPQSDSLDPWTSLTSKKEILSMKQNEAPISATFGFKTPVIMKSDRIETLKRMGERRNTVGSLKEFGLEALSLISKGDPRRQLPHIQQDGEGTDFEEGDKVHILVGVSQGGRLLKDKVTLFEESDGEGRH